MVEACIARAHRQVFNACRAAEADYRLDGVHHDLQQIGYELERIQASLLESKLPMKGQMRFDRASDQQSNVSKRGGLPDMIEVPFPDR
jgi:hypothetical protein